MSEYEDLRNMQASMERLLHEEGDLMESAPEGSGGDFNGNPPEGQELLNRLATEIDQDNNNMAVDDDDDEADEEEEDDDGEEEEAEEDDCSNGSPADEDHSNNSHLNEEWHSGLKSLIRLWNNILFSFSSFMAHSFSRHTPDVSVPTSCLVTDDSIYVMDCFCISNNVRNIRLPSHYRWQRRGPVCGGTVSR